MIDISNFSLSFPFFRLDISSLSFPEKGFVLLEGDNGCGKSSFFRVLLGIQRQYIGEIIFQKKNLSTLSQQDLIQKVSYLPQISHKLPSLLVNDFIQQGLYLQQENQLDSLIKKLNIKHLLDKKCSEISGGEQQLITIARNLAIKKPVILLDEPDAFLSKKNQELLKNLLVYLSQESLVVMISHRFQDTSDLKITITEKEENHFHII